MNKVFRFFQISLDDKSLLMKTYFLLWTVRLMLWIFKIQRIVNFTERIGSSTKDNPISVKKIVYAVNSTSPYVPKASCLTRSLVARILLKQYGYKSEIKIGVAKGDDGQLNAHAWVEVNNKTVIGASDIEYTPILTDLNKYSLKLD